MIDPITGDKVVLECEDNVRKVKVKVEPCSIEYPSHVQKCTTPLSTPGEKVRSCERSKEKVSDSEKKLEKLIPQPMRNVLGFSVARLEPLTNQANFENESCVRCGARPVAWQVTDSQGCFGFLCASCGEELAEQQQPEQEDWVLKREGSKVYTRDGNVLYECQYCKGVGLPMFFATKQDLDTHILRLHTGQPMGGK